MTQRPSNPLPSAHLLAPDDELDRLMHPGRFYQRPADVLIDTTLTPAEQRAILSSWASKACAAEAVPILACEDRSPGRQEVSFEEIMDALLQLDRGEAPVCGHSPKSLSS
jgi:hypothetical protein